MSLPPKSHATPSGSVDDRRQERLAQALRDNLKRRKSQIRGRAVESKPAPERPED